MSLEIWLYPKKSTKKKLISELKLQGFKETNHIFSSASDDGERHFYWFESNNYESFSGVEATIRRSTKEEQEKYDCAEWILHTRTRSSGCFLDKDKQNKVIKHMRSIFAGSFYNDWYGTNRYINIDDYPKYSAPERGLIIMRDNIANKISGLKYSISQIPNNMIGLNSEINDQNFIKHLKSIDPSLTIYNAMLPFLVSIIEFMFKEAFLVLIRYDTEAQEKIKKANLKISLDRVIQVKNKELLIEELIAETFTFQNINQTSKAYKDYLDIDIRKIFHIKKKINNRVFRIMDKIEEIIQLRHSIIHHFGYYTDLDQELFLLYLNTIDSAHKLFIESLQKKYNWKIDEI